MHSEMHQYGVRKSHVSANPREDVGVGVVEFQLNGFSCSSQAGGTSPQSEVWPPTEIFGGEYEDDTWDENLVIICWFYVKNCTSILYI